MPKATRFSFPLAVLLLGCTAISSNAGWFDLGAKPGRDRRPILSVNNTYGMVRAVRSGLGLASLPDFVAAEQDDLMRVLPESAGPPNEAYFVYPEELRSSKRISVFRDFLLRKVAEGRLG